MESVKVFANTSTLIAVSSVEMDFIRKVAPHYGEALGISNFEPDILLQEGELKIGNLTFQVIQTPGHSPGSVCIYWPDKKTLFTGDVVFNQGIGRTDLPGGDGQELKESIKRISLIDAEYLVSGHGDILSGSEKVKANFGDIERMWFPYL
jgi:glyoxylase-like metal-dependent hydrolase (beta-lactamase superfamily II)